MFYSTRDSSLKITASEAILKGLSDEGGLFLPEEIKSLDASKLLDKTYQEIAFAVLRLYLDDFTDGEIKEAIRKAYSADHFKEKIAGLASFGNYSFLELFHGQTLTFKDMALSLLPYLMETALQKHPEVKKIHILTATSGDTGSAVLSSFSHSENISVSVLYPNNGISLIQEKQMLSFTGPHSRAYALKDGNFDDCQTYVKKILTQEPRERGFSSANSINIGRLLPQIIYYYFAYIEMVKEGQIRQGDAIDVIVPTGNFGDIFAAYLAKKMSLPLGKLVVASNANRVLTDFFAKGIYSLKRDFYLTNSPSMDILISSNLERLLYLACLSDQKVVELQKELKTQGFFKVDCQMLSKLQEDFVGFSADDKETEQAIASCYKDNKYLIDPHTAVAFSAYKKFLPESEGHKALIVATASPLKFPLTIASALNLKADKGNDLKALEAVIQATGISVPSQLSEAIKTKTEKFVVSRSSFYSLLNEQRSFSVRVPASSANLGPGFDVCGLALNLFNVFEFQKASSDELAGFKGDEEIKDNLVLSSYRRYFEKTGLGYVPVRISQIKNDVPISRGLGSSATCIVAGLLAANEMCGRLLSNNQLKDLAAAIEGHPDNVACCLLGGCVASFRNDEGELISLQLPVSSKLGFLACIPDQELSTFVARSILPKAYPLKDITYDASRLVMLPQALKEGDLSALEEVIKDKLHAPYRLSLIKESEIVQDVAMQYHLPFTVSGAGSTLLVIYRKEEESTVDNAIEKMKKRLSQHFDFLKLDICTKGAETSEVKHHE